MSAQVAQSGSWCCRGRVLCMWGVIGIAVPVLVASCVTTPYQHSAPEVTLVDVQFQQAKMLETALVFTVRIANESPEAMTVNGGVFRFYLDGHRIGKGMSQVDTVVSPLSTTTTDVVVYISNLQLARILPSFNEKAVFAYEIRSTLYVRVDDHSRRVTSKRDGVLDLEQYRGGRGAGVAQPSENRNE